MQQAQIPQNRLILGSFFIQEGVKLRTGKELGGQTVLGKDIGL